MNFHGHGRIFRHFHSSHRIRHVDIASCTLFEDKHIIVLNKPSGSLVQGDDQRTSLNGKGIDNLFDAIKAHLVQRDRKKGGAWLGLVHRLDRPSSGVLVYAKTSKAAGRLSEQFRTRHCEKNYLAVVEGSLPYLGLLSAVDIDFDEKPTDMSTVSLTPPSSLSSVTSGVRCSHWLNTTLSTDRVSIVDSLPVSNSLSHKAAKYVSAVLTYYPLHTFTPTYNKDVQHTLVTIALETGRKHQIRAQMAHIGHPIVGDGKYGALTSFPTRDIALHAYTLTIVHPVTQEVMKFVAPPPALWNKRFGEDVMQHIK